jgi:hypothetical protein
MKAITTTLALTLFACLPAHGANEKLRIDELGKVGVGTATPSTKLEVNGALTIGDVGETEAPKAGTIKFDGTDFLGYDGSSWRSLTLGASSGSGDSTSGAASGSLLALPAGDPAPAGYTFVKAMDKALQWEEMAPRNFAGSGGSIQALDDKLYYTGAYSHGGEYPIQPPEKYDPVTNQWTVIHSPDVPRAYGVSVAHEGKLYFLGGLNPGYGIPTEVVEIYDPQKNFWSRGPKLPFDPNPLYLSGAVSSGGKIYVSAGDRGGYLGADLLSLDVAKGIWEENHWANPDPEASEVYGNLNITPYGTLLGYEGKVYLFGDGINGWTTYVFDPATKQWSWEANMWDGKTSTCYWTYGGRIFQGGGGSIRTYDPRTGITERTAIVGVERDDFSSSSVAVLDDYVYVLASGDNPNRKELYRASLKNQKDLYLKD